MPPQTPADPNGLNRLFARIRQLEDEIRGYRVSYEQFTAACEAQPRSITAEIDEIPGRRIFYNLVGTVSFTAAQAGLRGTPVSMLISQDGPFIATHYPLAIWAPNSPSDATNFGTWSPVASWPLPTQQVTNLDIIDLSYEVQDSGSQRNFQNLAAPPIFSRPDDFAPLPVPTLFAPNTTIQIFPTYNRIFFNGSTEKTTTGGLLTFAIPGYRIVNM
jgi:hypothetical protein